MRPKKIKLNKFIPIFRIPKEWIDPPEEKRTKIPLLVNFKDEKTIIINKQ